MAAAAAGISAVGSIIGGISANNQAKAQANARELQASSDADLARQQFDLQIGAGRAQAGGSGLSLLGGSNEAIFNFNAMAQGDTISDILFAGAVDAANLRHEGKMAKIGGFIDAGASVAGGVAGAKRQKAAQQQARAGISPPRVTAPQGTSALPSRTRSLLRVGARP